jgi:predicted KAP-like P-loop ATPase
MSDFSLFSDIPVVGHDNDKLEFDRYLCPLLSKLTDPNAQTPFTIGIFGQWGSGKSSLLTLLDKKLESDYNDKFLKVHFNPWVYRNEKNILVPLLHTLQDTLDNDPRNRFVESAKKIGSILLNLGADILLKSFTANTISMENLENVEKKYLEQTSKVKSEVRNLKNTLQSEVNTIASKDKRIIFFIDDLDRCAPDQIIDLLESLKLFFDLEHIFIILAIDKEVIDRGIEVKYGEFNFAAGREAAIGAEYLEKMVQLPLQLFPLLHSQVRDFIESFKPPEIIKDQLDLLTTIMTPNPRKIKRILNILIIMQKIVSTQALKELKIDIIARLVVIQVQSSELYADVVKQPKLLVTLEAVYTKEKKLDNEDDFFALGPLAESIIKLCDKYYLPEGYLSKVFVGSPFIKVEDKLSIYLSMLVG